ncbi:MAG: LicD family protein [Clostridia bacterium]|nr:LicD family protein [Clostridia bacterium]
MIENIFSDELRIVSKYVDKCVKYYGQSVFDTIYLISDSNPVAAYLAPAISNRYDQGNFVIVEAFDNSSVNKEYCGVNYPGAIYISLEEFRNVMATDNSAYILLNDSNLCDENWFDILALCEDKAKATRDSRILFGTVLPPIRTIPGEIQQFAEREYNYFLEKIVTDRTEAENYYLALEKKCRQIVKSGFEKLNLLRFDNLMDSNTATTPSFDLTKIVKDALSSGKLEITQEDFLNKYSFIHTRDAACVLFKTLYTARPGHIYNVTLYNVSLAELKMKLHKFFADKLSLTTNTPAFEKTDIKFHCLSRLKAKNNSLFSRKMLFKYDEAIYRILCNAADVEYDVQTKLGCYQGKLQRLKDIEIDILAEIDRICKENDIKWFLAGGSLLGAIREGKSIAWDDDLDIGFLREDFEKFKKIAPKELDKKYYYSSPWTDDNCHYYIDKIRLKDSYFSTAYSNHFELEDGVFVDLIVYDQTSSNRLLEKLQIKFICAMVRILNIRWYNVPRKNYRYKLTKRILPFLRLIPWKVLHKLFDIAATMFSKKKNAKYLLDSTGQHIRYGRFPKYYLEELTEAELDGLKCPIPVHYAEYLSFFYGENYFPKPSITSQVGAHQFARLDLGEFVFEDKQPGDFREVNIKGELFEDEID